MSPLPAIRLHTVRARLLAAALLALGLAAAVFAVVAGFLAGRAQQAAEATLREQAAAVALAFEREGPDGTVRAAGFLPDTRIVVRQGDEVQYWNRAVSDFDASARAVRGDVEVLLQRDVDRGLVDAWLAPLLAVIALAGLALLVWLLTGRIARRLRRSAGDLASHAEQVAQGDLTARAPVAGDELGRIAAAFNRMTERLQQADARERAFLADVAHELRTPVTAIEGFAQALADGTARSDEDRAEAAAFIREEAARLNLLVSDLRRLTWLELDPPVALAPADLAQVARAAVARVAGRAGGKGVEVAAPNEALVAVTDPDLVTTILDNLLDNAVRHTPRGGRVEVTLAARGGAVELAVADTGDGIPAEHLPHVFDRMYRAEPSRSRGEGGSGLGLAIVRRAAERLGGTASAESTHGEGSVFTVTIPAAAPAAPPAGVPAGAAA